MNSASTLDYANDFLGFINEASTAFHAVDASKRRLRAAGFEQLSELDAWALQPGGKYFFVRNDTAIIAFAVGKDVDPSNVGYTVLGAHTDSPCLKVSRRWFPRSGYFRFAHPMLTCSDDCVCACLLLGGRRR